MTFQEALRLRLNIIQPTQQQIREFLKARPSTLSPGIKWVFVNYFVFVFPFFSLLCFVILMGFLIFGIFSLFIFFSPLPTPSTNREFVTRLRKANKTVYLITGGFDCIIEPVADELGIPLDHMFANKLYFHFNGVFCLFINKPFCIRFDYKFNSFVFCCCCFFLSQI